MLPGAAHASATPQLVTNWVSGVIEIGLGVALALFAGVSSWAMAFGMASAASMLMTPPWEAQLRKKLQGAVADD